MTDYGTIKLPRDEYERHNEERKNNGQTWEQYINGQAPEIRNGSEVDYDDVKAACQAAIRDELPDGVFR